MKKVTTTVAAATQTAVLATTKTVRVDLIQGDKKISFTTEIDNAGQILENSEVSGTVAHRIVTLFRKVRKFGVKLDGFSFARKFDVSLTIDGTTSNGTNSIANGVITFGLTIQDNPASVEKFGAFIDELVSEVMTGKSKEVIELGELVESFDFSKN